MGGNLNTEDQQENTCENRCAYTRLQLALTKAAGITLAAAFFIDNRGFTALGTQVTNFHGRATRDGEFHFFLNGVTAVAVSICLFFGNRWRAGFLAQVHIEHLSDSIW